MSKNLLSKVLRVFQKFLREKFFKSFCVKFVRNAFFLVRIFRIQTEHGDLLCKSPYSVQMRESTDQKSPILNTFNAKLV